MKDIIILGGPNGAGKTTAAQVLLPRELELLEFVNADEIARGLSPFDPSAAEFAAGRMMIDRMRALVRESKSFAFETTCAGRTHATFLRQCRAVGWRITLIYLWLTTPRAALDRVARRIAEGGHSVPSEVVLRRYLAGVRNMRRLYLPLADIATIYDNADEGRILIARKEPDAPLSILDTERWTLIENVTQ